MSVDLGIQVYKRSVSVLLAVIKISEFILSVFYCHLIFITPLCESLGDTEEENDLILVFVKRKLREN